MLSTVWVLNNKKQKTTKCEVSDLALEFNKIIDKDNET